MHVKAQEEYEQIKKLIHEDGLYRERMLMQEDKKKQVDEKI